MNLLPRIRSFLARGADEAVSTADYLALASEAAVLRDRVALLEDALTHAEHARVVAEGELDAIRRQRSDATRKGNETRRARLQPTTDRLRAEHAAHMAEQVTL